VPFILLNKPFRVLSQFTDAQGRDTLADKIDAVGTYPAGRLDYDSEGLLILTDDGRLQARISQPLNNLKKHYWVQIDGAASEENIVPLLAGVTLRDGQAKAESATLIDEPSDLWPRTPPIRYRKSVPTSWLDITISEGRNRQVRRMTAAAGIPTLRLIRHRIGPWSLDGLRPGESLVMETVQAWRAIEKFTG